MKSFFLSFLLFVLCVFCLPTNSQAGAWGKAKGEMELILEGFVLSESETTDKGALEIYSENGLGGGISFVNEVNLQFEEQRTLSTISAHSVKYARSLYDNWSAGVMLGIDLKITDFEDQIATLGPTARLLLGRGFERGYWINSEIGVRERDDEASYFGEVAVGKRFKNNDLLIAKYITEGGYLSNFGSNIQISYAKTLSENWKIDFGYREAIGNNSRPKSSGFLVGIWWQK